MSGSGQYKRTEFHRENLRTIGKKKIKELNPHWKGGIHKRKDGYILIRIGVIKKSSKGARYKLKHRIVMEEYLGRPLLRTEIVHHKNGNKGDNRINNLEVMTQTQHINEHRIILLKSRKDLKISLKYYSSPDKFCPFCNVKILPDWDYCDRKECKSKATKLRPSYIKTHGDKVD